MPIFKQIESQLQFISSYFFQIQFVYTVGDGYGSSAAIDDVMLAPGKC